MLHDFIVIGEPVSKPRMSQADRWKLRRCVIEFRQWADKCREACTGKKMERVAQKIRGATLSFFLPVPASLRESQKKELYGKDHGVRPDLDNLVKGVLDSLFDNDSSVSVIHAMKYYHEEGGQPRAEVSLIPFPSDDNAA